MIRHSIAFRGVHAAVLGLLAGAAFGCSSNLGDAIRPKEGTATEALGQDGLGTCEADYAKPLVIDISPEDRGDLEAKLKQGGPVVRFDCKSMKVLPTCRMKDVRYSWVGYTPKAQLVEMESGDDLGAALPLNGMSFKAALERSGRLNLATMTVGQRSAGMMAVDRDKLEGDCDQATHVINSVWVGAFKLETGSKGEVMAAADVFGAEAHAGSKSERKSMNSDGDVKACEGAKEDATSPPSGCTAFVRLELLRIPPKGARPAVVADNDGGGQAGASSSANEKEKEKPVSCPPGRTWNGVFCAAAAAQATNVCNSKNLGVCQTKCDKKDGAACYTLYIDANVNKKDEAAAKRFSEKACEAGEERGCSARGFLAGRDKDEQAQILWFTKGCFGGHALSCGMAADRYRSAKEPVKAFTFNKRACDLGDAMGCDNLARAHLKGEGTPKDIAKGVELFEKQCRSGQPMACTSLAREYESGKLLTKDFGLAERWFRSACAQPNGSFACMTLGDFYGRRNEQTNAEKAYNAACDRRVSPACTKVGRSVPAAPPPGPPGPQKAPPPPKGAPPSPPKAKTS